uniref:DUF4378 domain-containing protein n=1 Tax=Kalanchoe fedtschenkoi TaxID=63787 RepID=A0A7N0U183_KALFE
MEKKPSRMDNRLIKPVLLKDYLLDELSSCSSNGFKSLPRHRCISSNTTVRFLVDKDIDLNPNHKLKPRTASATSADKSRPMTAAISAFQKASEAVINAVKLLSVHNRSSVRSGFLARSFSRKVFKRTFWKRSCDGQIKDSEIHRWKTFHNLISEFPDTPTHFIPAATATTATSDSSSICGGNCKSGGSSWSDNEFSASSSSVCLSSHEDHLPVEKSSDGSADDAGEDSSDSGATAAASFVELADKVEKEQFSPVSVFEGPFHRGGGGDGEDGSSPDFDSELVGTEGTKKKKLVQRLERFGILGEVEPVDLDKRLGWLSESEDDVKNGAMIELEAAEKAQTMLELVKSRAMAATFCADNLLLDLFMDSLRDQTDDREVTELAESYLAGEGAKTASDCYIREMERGGAWRGLEDQRADVAGEVEGGVWACLVDELVSELEEVDIEWFK